MVKIEKTNFGKYLNPLTTKVVEVHRYIMTNNSNMSVAILTRGAIVQSIKYPDKYGKIKDVCLGFDNNQGYTDNRTTYMGAAVGRVANRVAQGKFKMDCAEYCVNKNFKNKYQINGGFIGFDCMVWEVTAVKSNGFAMQHVNPNGFEGYPGELTTTITFTLDDDNNFGVFIEAETTKKTPINITHYMFLNLAGHNTRKEGLFLHNILIKSKLVVDCDEEQIPNGCLTPVKNTLFDFRKYVFLGKRIKKLFSEPIKGFDKHFCTEACDGKIKPIAKVIHPCTGRWLEISSNQSSLHFFTCNDWPDIEEAGEAPIIGKDKAIYAKHGAFSLASQNYPDAINNNHFPCSFLEPGQKYCHIVIYRFGCSD